MPHAGRKTLVIGCGYTMLTGLNGRLPDGSVVVVEDRRLIERQRGGLRERASRLPVVARLVAGEFLDGTEPGALVRLLPQGTTVDRVIPGTDEVSTIVSAGVAEELGLPGATVRAAAILRDKLELRQAARAAGLRNPRWRQVFGPDDLAKAAGEYGCDDVVLKPATRSGSRGVLLLHRDDDVKAAWRETSAEVAASAPDGGAAGTRYLVEERVYGPEVSVECLVAAGEIVFGNVTRKRVAPGRHPVETGHALPAPVDPAVGKELLDCMQVLVGGVGFGYGVLHGEWILAPDGPVLVECAGRIPGDEITNLLSLAYGVPFIARYSELMTGSPRAVDDALGWAAVQSAAITFLTPAAGVVRSVSGVEEAASRPGVCDVEVEVGPGDRVADLRSSADRVGFVVAVGDDPDQASHRADDAAARIAVRTVP